MKMTIEWHMGCLKNHLLNLEGERANVERAKARLVRSEEDYLNHKKQVDEAIKRGLTEFDGERFLKRRSA